MWREIVAFVEKIALGILAYLAGRKAQLDAANKAADEAKSQADAIRKNSAGLDRDALIERLRTKD